MGTTFRAPGEVVTRIAPAGGVTVNVPVQIGQLFIVPVETVAATLSFRGHVTGEHVLPKTGTQAWAEGAIVYWDDASGACTTVATGNLRIGSAAEVVDGGASTIQGRVRLDGVARPQEST